MNFEEKKRLHDERLKHYATREPKEFVQFDCFLGQSKDDCAMHPDDDGDCVIEMGNLAVELMVGSDLRVFMPPELLRRDAVRLLRKVADRIESENQVGCVGVDMTKGLVPKL